MLSASERRALLDGVVAHGGPYAKAPKLADAHWRAIEGLLRPRRLSKGDFFVKPGEPAREVGIVRSGLLRFYYTDADGSEATKAFRGPGELAAPYAELLLGVPARTHIQALEDCALLVADYARLHALLDKDVELQRVARLIAEHYYVVKERREYELLQLSAEERFLRFDREYPGLAARIPQYHVASYLGVTPVALSRIVSRRRKKG